MVVNVAMSWTAVRSFPGLATTHGFDDSNGYDRVLVAAGRQAALGWTVRDTLQANRPVILLTGRAGAPLAGAKLAATIERPIGEADPVPVAFHAAGPGRFEADAALPPGAWDIDLTVTAEGGVFHTTRRLIAR
jgi:nitrogen fixation protein FixH